MAEQERLWQKSPTPEESWSDASGGNENGEWPILGVVGEEIRLDGTERYEVRWGNWSRPDGSNTTWQTDIIDRDKLLASWKRVQRRKRNALANESLDMDVPWPDDAVHKRLTEQRAQAYEEKLAKREAAPVSTVEWDAEVDAAYARLQEPEIRENNPRLRVRRGAGAVSSPSVSVAASLSRKSRTSSSPALSIASSGRAPPPPPAISAPRRGRPPLNSGTLSSSRQTTATLASTPSTSSPSGFSTRMALSASHVKESQSDVRSVLQRRQRNMESTENEQEEWEKGMREEEARLRLQHFKHEKAQRELEGRDALLSSSLRSKSMRTSSSAGSSGQASSIQLPSIVVSQPSIRRRVQTTWNRAAQDVLASAVRISSDIADEDIPRNLIKFKYIEKGYDFADGLQEIFKVSRDVFTICDCSVCTDAVDCYCQDSSELYDDSELFKVFAYSKGLFMFNVPRGREVIECNKYCNCSYKCENRVAQRPRDVIIEIFDTKRCGWGARALVAVPKGKVLGTYTGMLIRREDVENVPEEHQGYLFDLDGTEVRDGENLGGRYTVDSYACGNWTRFVNHSCNPNMQVYSVVYDTIPHVNMPYVAFVASKDIAAGTELTIDYHPYVEEETSDRKGKRPANARTCRCGSTRCRGWIKFQ
ncbi:hypothetical protein HYDPIDRAFT_105624 [Hydnomerulius pinastri MD-312]|nr:hypothetical protein HYDPIDRAFT_105624 [Hydnomerulius pinastri MD-312]